MTFLTVIFIYLYNTRNTRLKILRLFERKIYLFSNPKLTENSRKAKNTIYDINTQYYFIIIFFSIFPEGAPHRTSPFPQTHWSYSLRRNE